MAVSTYIITISDFIGRVNVSENVLTNRLKSDIGPIQEMFGIKILCNEFYAEVLAVVAGTTTSAVITTLLPKIKDFLVFKIYADYLVDAGALSTPAGIRVSIDATSEPASDLIVSQMIAKAEGRAVYYQDQLVNFLTLNQDDYPTWRDSICGCSDRRVKNNNQFSIVGGNKRKTPIEWT